MSSPKRSWGERPLIVFEVLMLTTPALLALAMSRKVSRPNAPPDERAGSLGGAMAVLAWAGSGRLTWVV